MNVSFGQILIFYAPGAPSIWRHLAIIQLMHACPVTVLKE